MPVRPTLLSAAALLALVVTAPGSLGAATPQDQGEIAPASLPRPFAGRGVYGALAREHRIPVVVTLRAGGLPSARHLATRRARIAALRRRALAANDGRELTVTARWAASPAFAARVTERGLRRLLRSPEVLRVDLDVPVRATLGQSAPLIRADQAQAAGRTGKGVTVAVLDTGIDTDHPDLVDDLVAEQCFARLEDKGACPNGSSAQSGPGSAEDDEGHGTLVSSIITSRGTESPRGVAPDAKIVAVKVLSAEGSGMLSGIVSGLDWLVNNRPDVKVVNMSLGSSELFRSGCDTAPRAIAYSSLINALRSRGVTVFVASGNDGSSSSIGAPACVASAVSVGSVDDATGFDDCGDGATTPDRVSCFSNSTEELDLLAPGSRITSAKLGGGSETWSGTSAATPHAAAVAALLLEARPDLSPDQVETTLEATGVRVTDHRNRLSFPRVDALAAVNAAPALAPPAPPAPYLPTASTTFPAPTGDAAGPDVASATLVSAPNGILTFTIATPNRTTLAANETIWILLDVDRNAATGGQGADYALVALADGTTDLLRWSGSWKFIRGLADASYAGGVLTVKISEDELGARSDFAFVVQSQTATSVSDRSPRSGAWPFPSVPLVVTKAGTGTGSVSSDAANGILCGPACVAPFARGSAVTLTAAPGTGSAFVEWGGACAGLATCTVAMNDLVGVSARFELLRRLAVAKEGTGGGSVTAAGAIACGETCAAAVPHGSSVVFTAQPDPGSRFDGWTGACAGPESCELGVDADKTVTARFTDAAPPTAEALKSVGRRGRPAELRFRVRDNGAGVRVQLTIYSGTRKLAILRRGPLAPDGDLEAVAWKVPRTFKGKGRFCVRGTDLAGNSSTARCARIALP